PMKNAGHVEHLVKGVIEFLGVIKWNHGFDKKYKDFDSRFRGFLAILAEYGEIELARKYLHSFSSLFSEKDARYIRVLSIKTYIEWISGNLDDALRAGEKAEYLLQQRSASDDYGVLHTLALVRRDIGGGDRISKSLEYFLNGESIDVMRSGNELRPSIGAP